MILFNIFSYLNSPDLFNCNLVCRRFVQVAQQILYNELTFCNDPVDPARLDRLVNAVPLMDRTTLHYVQRVHISIHLPSPNENVTLMFTGNLCRLLPLLKEAQFVTFVEIAEVGDNDQMFS
jgi:hypothetical protein